MRPYARTTTAIAAAALWCGAALAAEPTGSLIGDAFLRTLEANGYADARAARVERDGAGLTLHEVAADAPEGPRLSIDRVALERPTITAGDALAAQRITYNGVALGDEATGARTTIASVTLEEPVLPIERAQGAAAGGERRLSDLAGSFGRLAITDLSTAAGRDDAPAEPLTVAGLVVEPGGRDGAPDGGRIVVEALSFSTNLLDARAAQELASLGYDTLSLDVVGEAAWDREGGRLDLETATVRVANVGTLAVTAELDGITAAALARISGGVSDFAALLSALDSAKVNAVSFAFADDGLTETLLARAARSSGLARDELARSLVGTLNGALLRLGDPAFAERVSAAAREFLEEPGRIAVSASPRDTLSLAELAGVALMRPDALPRLLNLTIEAAP